VTFQHLTCQPSGINESPIAVPSGFLGLVIESANACASGLAGPFILLLQQYIEHSIASPHSTSLRQHWLDGRAGSVYVIHWTNINPEDSSISGCADCGGTDRGALNKMPINIMRNPFRKQDENARPTTGGAERPVNGVVTKPIEIKEKQTEPTEYKLSGSFITRSSHHT